LGVFHSSGQRLSPPAAIVTNTAELRAITTGSRSTKEIDAAISRLEPASLLRVGGAGYKYWLLLTGDADVYVYPRPGMKLWDVCPGDAMLRMLGGRSTDPSGQLLSYDPDSTLTLGAGVVATTAGCSVGLHSEILAKLRP
jgi:3'(2'), 5'-bisphosphate nucleotidase